MPQIDIQILFLFLIPGFITLKVYYLLIGEKKDNQFEYFMLSCFWGLAILVFYGLISKKDNFTQLLNNIYASAFIFSIVGIFFAFLAAYIIKPFLKKKK